ncbi:M48 family metallopeptidase [Halobaculum sp. MBLA0143]|uniref:M48 family metallopeptidase n=1 Tax=Halobaculum sp. MBLA0143 TaxID=3079933 RepID=UPI0035264412
MVSRTSTDTRGGARTLRVAATLAAALSATVGVAAGLAGLLAPWLAAVLPSGAVGVALLTGLLTVGLVAVQLRYVRRGLLSEVDATVVSRDDYPELHARLTRLAGTADAPVPDLAVVDSAVPNSCSVAGSAAGTVVVSAGLLSELDDEELDAVLAHELAHLRNRDAVVLTLASFLPAVVAGDYSPVSDLGLDDRPAGAQWLLGGAVVAAGYFLAAPSLPAPAWTASSFVAYAGALVGVVVLGGIALGVAATATLFLARELSREREFAADRAAAELTGSPAAVAGALQRLADAGPTATDARRARAAHVAELSLLPFGFERDSSSPETSLFDSFSLDTRAHPPVERRVEALTDTAAARARATPADD